MMRRLLLPLLLPVVAIMGSCAVAPRAHVAEELIENATIPGMPQARFWGDRITPQLNEWIESGFKRERAYLDSQGIAAWPDTSYLALSGGGSDGAYGAGLLCGWTAHGDRPTFRVVTGVSTGALIAPFAFVGPDYDHVLREVYTTISTRDIGASRGIIDGLLGDSLMDPVGLRRIVERHVDQAFLERVAAEYHKGRGLVVGTTNLDAQLPVIWALGAIAASGHPDSLELFRDVMIASAAIPAVFPPVMIRVEAGGRTFDEMHADGGVSSQVFLYPASLSIKDMSQATGVKRRRSVFVIRNAQLAPSYEPVSKRTLQIAHRAVSTLIKTQGVGDLYRIYLGCTRDELDFNLASIPVDFSIKPKEEFDPVYMKALFELGFEQAKSGYAWQKAPPGFEPPGAPDRRPRSAVAP